MNDQGPYRQLPKFLLCPRCGEMLDRAFDDVLACMRCRGIFITPPTAGLAFGDAAWPADAAAMWWKSALECPVCSYHGAPSTMAAQSFEGTQIDRCAQHGLWLDQGELNRLAGTRGDELAVLRNKLHGDLDGELLDAKREAWRRDVEKRRQETEAANARLAAERERLIARADQRAAEERAVLEYEQRMAEVANRPIAPPPLFDPSGGAEPEVLHQPAPTWREVTEAEQRREAALGEVMRSIGELELQLSDLRRKVRAVESALSSERVRLRALTDSGRRG